MGYGSWSSQEGQAEWDQRQLYHTRLHEAILKAHRSNFLNDYFGWYKALNVLRLELSAHLRNDEERELINKAFSPLNDTMMNRSINELAKYSLFMKAQEAVHTILRKRGLDVPVYEEDGTL